MTTKVWLDMDTGVDDSVAILTATQFKNVEIVGATAVGGNQTLEHTFENTRDVLALANHPEIKVYKGAEKPLDVDLVVAPHCHGENGLGDAVIPHSDAAIETADGIEMMYETAKKLKGDLVLVATGPLTDVALLLERHKDAKDYIKKIAIMGGGAYHGNVTKYAEFNAHADPRATREVFESGIEIIMCGLDVTMKAYLSKEEIDEIASCGNMQGKFLQESTPLALALYERTNGPGFCVHDACPLFYLEEPELFETEKAFVYGIEKGERAGQTVCDFTSKTPNTTVVMNVDRDEFARQIAEIYKNYEIC